MFLLQQIDVNIEHDQIRRYSFGIDGESYTLQLLLFNWPAILLHPKILRAKR